MSYQEVLLEKLGGLSRGTDGEVWWLIKRLCWRSLVAYQEVLMEKFGGLSRGTVGEVWWLIKR